MLKNLVSRSQFAASCGVSATAVTNACKRSLLAACVGKKIDANHVAATTYAQNQEDKKTTEPVVGIDSLYEQAVSFCQSRDKPTPNALRAEFKIGSKRADRIFATIKAAGLLPVDSPTPPETEPTPPAARAVSGHTAARETKKSEALHNLENGRTLHKVPEDIEKFVDMTLREIIERYGSDIAFLDWLKATKEIENINEKRLKNAQTRGELVSRRLVKIGVVDPINAVHIKLLTDGSKTIARRVTAMHEAGRPLEDIEKFVAGQITSFIRPVKSKVARALRNV